MNLLVTLILSSSLDACLCQYVFEDAKSLYILAIKNVSTTYSVFDPIYYDALLNNMRHTCKTLQAYSYDLNQEAYH